MSESYTILAASQSWQVPKYPPMPCGIVIATDWQGFAMLYDPALEPAWIYWIYWIYFEEYRHGTRYP
ncbi:MAG: hypothetical protein WCP34_08780 [Pseudomonadota bacterium]